MHVSVSYNIRTVYKMYVITWLTTVYPISGLVISTAAYVSKKGPKKSGTRTDERFDSGAPKKSGPADVDAGRGVGGEAPGNIGDIVSNHDPNQNLKTRCDVNINNK